MVVNYSACPSLPRTPENTSWYRHVEMSYLPTALASSHTRASRSRFNPGDLLVSSSQFDCLYLADDPTVAQFEAGAQLGKYGIGRHAPHPTKSFASLTVRVILQDVIDISEPAAQNSLSTTVQELTGDWFGYQARSGATAVPLPTGFAPTQELGYHLFQTGVEGFRATSAQVAWSKTLTIFPDNMRKGSSVIFRNASAAIVHQVRGSKP
jgi:hypothetical protein